MRLSLMVPVVLLLAFPAWAEPAAVDPDGLADLVATLEDPDRRERLVADLKALLAARAEAEAPAPSLAARASVALSRIGTDIGAFLAAAGLTVADLPDLGDWLAGQWGDPAARARWLALGGELAAVLAMGLLAAGLGSRALAGTRRRLGGRRAGRGQRMALGLADLVPVAAFLVAAVVMTAVVDPPRVARDLLLILVSAVTLALAGRVAIRHLVPTDGLDGRLPPTIARALRRLATAVVAIGALAYAVGRGAYALTLPPAVRDGLLDLLGILATGLLVAMVWRVRRPVGRAIAGTGRGHLAGLRRPLARVWPVLATGYLIAMLVVANLDIAGGLWFLLRASLLTGLILGLAWLAWSRLSPALAGALGLTPGPAAGPAAARRVRLYRPLIDRVTGAAAILVAAVAVLAAWDVPILGLLAHPVARRLAEAGLTIVVVALAAMVLYEVIRHVIERRLGAEDADGAPQAVSGRTRTLLQLLRNSVLIVLAVMVGLVALAEVGVDIAPLLAGAGVVGIAVGFGAQSLVKDVINGVFILAEDLISVGDVVQAGGHAGLVEDMNLRTVRLRDLAGSVHTLPYSEVTSLVNMTRDFSFYLMDVAIAYWSDVDRVIGVLEDLGAEMQADPEHGPKILAPIEILGVDRFADSAVVIKARIKTRPIEQWGVGRAFNRRLKARFEAAGVDFPYPQVTVHPPPGMDMAPLVAGLGTPPRP